MTPSADSPAPAPESLPPSQGEASRRHVAPTCGALLSVDELFSRGGYGSMRCEAPVMPPRKSGCCDRHKSRLWDEKHPRVHKVPVQARIDVKPPLELIRLIGPTPEDVRASQKAQTVKVLHMLKAAGPQGVTTHDFLAAGVGRFGARINELRKVLWTITMRKLTPTSALYTLEGRS